MAFSHTTSAVKSTRILVRGVNWLGDAVMSTPALQRLGERFGRDSITLLTDSKLVELYREHPSVGRVLSFERGESPFTVARRLKHEKFDIALVFPGSTRSALEVWAAGIPRRIGRGGRFRGWFLTELTGQVADSATTSATATPITAVAGTRKRSVKEIKMLALANAGRTAGAAAGVGGASPIPAKQHHLHQYLELGAALGCATEPVPPSLFVSEAERAAATQRWVAPGLGGGSSGADDVSPAADIVRVGICPSAAYGEAKRWPLERFAGVVRIVSSQLSRAAERRLLQFVAFGAADDVERCEEIARLAGVPVLNLAGKTSLRELMALLASCAVVLTNDSGPMHIAAALSTPVVALFGSTSAELTGPGLPGAGPHRIFASNVPCSPCFRRTCPIDFRCMTSIHENEVASAVLNYCQA